MSEIYEKAKNLARQVLLAELAKKEQADKVKLLKGELEEFLALNPTIDNYFSFQEGVVLIEEKENYEIADGLKEQAKITVSKIDPEIINNYFKGDIKLNKAGKKALVMSENPELSSMVDVVVKRSLKVKLA